MKQLMSMILVIILILACGLKSGGMPAAFKALANSATLDFFILISPLEYGFST